MTARILGFGWLLFIWVTLLGDLTLMNVAMGIAICSAILLVFRSTRSSDDRAVIRPWRVIELTAYFTWKFIQANIQVALAVIWPDRVRSRRAIIEVPFVHVSETATILLTNAVSLTPGTFIVEMRPEPSALYVHILQLSSVRDARLEILEMERRILLAVGPDGAAEQVAQRIASLNESSNQDPTRGEPS